MHAAYLYGPRDLRLIDQEPDPVGPGQLRVEVAYSGICGTDLHIYSGMVFGAGMALPRAFGHEYAGTVVEVGAGVTGVALGDRVTAMPSAPCRRCLLCRTGRESVCRHRYRARTGSWAPSIVVPVEMIWQVPADVSLQLAALTEPLACVWRAVDRARLRSADRVVIIGAGPIGLLIMKVVQASGARSVLVSEPSAHRRKMARQFGADEVLDPAAGNLGEAVRDLTDGLGADVVFEAVGLPATIEQAVDLVAPGGTLAIVGVTDLTAKAAISPQEIFFKELTIVGSREQTHGVDRALRWLGKLDLAPLITHTFPLVQVQAAIDLALSGQAGKVMLQP